MKSINLTQGKSAYVDDEDYCWLSEYRWQAQKDGNTFYALRSVKNDGGGYRKESMHTSILKRHNLHFEHLVTDHIDHNGLNNQKSNLRMCTNQQNRHNEGVSKNNKSGFKGVSWYRRDKKWRAFIYFNSKQIYLGLYEDKIEAARAYNRAAKRYFGEFAYLNKIPEAKFYIYTF